MIRRQDSSTITSFGLSFYTNDKLINRLKYFNVTINIFLFFYFESLYL